MDVGGTDAASGTTNATSHAKSWARTRSFTGRVLPNWRHPRGDAVASIPRRACRLLQCSSILGVFLPSRPNLESRNDMTHGLRPRDRAGAAALLAALALAAGCSNTNKITGATGNTNGTHLVVFSSDRGGAVGQYDLYLYDLDAGGFRAINGINSATFPDRHPTISSDARFIAFQSNRGGTSGSDILLYDRAVPAMVALNGANSNADETEPAFTGDAQRL